MPLHELKLRKGAVVMLLRNLSVRDSLCNGTRMVVDEMMDNTIWCRMLRRNGKLSENRYGIARYPFDYDDSETDKTGLQFRRVQFPLKVITRFIIYFNHIFILYLFSWPLR